MQAVNNHDALYDSDSTGIRAGPARSPTEAALPLSLTPDAACHGARYQVVGRRMKRGHNRFNIDFTGCNVYEEL